MASRRSSSKNRLRRPVSRRCRDVSVWEAICAANKRAHQRVNRRSMQRNGLRSVKATIAEVSEDVILLPPLKRFVRWIIALLLLPFCVVSTVALFTLGESNLVTEGKEFWIELLRTKEFLWFSVGMFLMVGWFWVGWLQNVFLYLYVLGHEVTHAIFVVGCAGKVTGIKVNLDGGYIITNKTNFLIALSPYFVPFWSVVILVASWILGCFWEIPYRDEALYFSLGASWLFHLLWTFWMIPKDQPDLQENGTFFSLVFIYLANVLVLSLLLCLAMGDGAILNFGYHWWSLFMDMLTKMYAAW